REVQGDWTGNPPQVPLVCDFTEEEAEIPIL
ncbi:rCG48203, partial [Rattus norvegicus]